MATEKVAPDEADLMENIAKLKQRKTSTKSALTKAKNKMLAFLELEDPDRKEIRASVDTVASLLVKAITAITDVARAYKAVGNIDAFKKTLLETEAVEGPIDEAIETVQVYLDNTASTNSSVSGSFGIRRLMKFSSSEVETNADTIDQVHRTPRVTYTRRQTPTPKPRLSLRKHDFQQQSEMQLTPESKVSDKKHDIGEDMWRQLRRVSIPVFRGNVKSYEGWRAAFMACVDSAPASNEYKLLQLKQYLSGEASDLVTSLGHSAAAYDVALERLDRKYGGKRRLIALKLDEINRFKPLRPGNSKDFDKFADILDVLVVTLRENDKHEELGDGCLYSVLSTKLTEDMLVQYHRFMFEQQRQESVETLREWVLQEAEFRTIAAETKSNIQKSDQKGSSKPGTFFGSNVDDKNKSCVVCQSSEHKIRDCGVFKKLDVSNRWQRIKKMKLCFRCLGSGHLGKDCTKSDLCGIDGCTSTHNQLLHAKRKAYSGDTIESTHPKPTKHVTMSTVDQDGFSALRTIPVVLTNGCRRIIANALLDDGSTQTYINEDVAQELGLKGRAQRISVNVLNSKTETFMSREVKFQLESMDGSVAFSMKGLTMNKVTGALPVIDWNKHKDRWQHLKGIPFPKVTSRPVVDVLIGIDYMVAHTSLRDVCGEPEEPVARLTPLGWTCVGRIDSADRKQSFDSFVTVLTNQTQDTLDQTLQNLWQLDSIPETKTPMSHVEQSAVESVEKTLTYDNGHYEVGIPWKKTSQSLHNNRKMAVNRLLCTEKRLAKDKVVAKSYLDVIKTYLSKGYIRKVPDEELSDTRWYLPHFPIVKMNRDTTKVRIVFDASAKDKGVSLNDVIEPGPKLQNGLFEILLRFRKFPVALVCDIEEMYLQIHLAQADRPFFRFLWRGDLSKPPEVYEFTRVVFGVNCSPFLAQYITQEHAKKLKEELPLAAEAVSISTYMDDTMDSVENENKGVQLHKELKELWSSAGMNARKWNSNAVTVVSQIPIKDRLKEVDIQVTELPSMKTLGLSWNPELDHFTFSNTALSPERSFTKRKFLSETARIFDPLGLLAPFTIRAKILLQEMWLSALDWDTQLNPDLEEKACNWHSEIQNLPSLSFPRCLSNNAEKEPRLHVFVDASEEAYGAVVYNVTANDNETLSTLVAAKSRVAPLKTVSIPRMELLAAVLGVKLLIAITTALNVALHTATLWSDSLNVLCWIRNQSRCFKPFVGNRVGYIHEHTLPSQWRYVPTSINPADILSRGTSVSSLANSEWQHGPEFLRMDEEHHPEQPSVLTQTEASEIKPQKRNQMTFVGVSQPDLRWRLDPTRFSDFKRLCRITAWVYRFIHNCRSEKDKQRIGELDVDELHDAEVKLVSDAQKDAFPEYQMLTSGKEIPPSSKLCRLQPFLDEGGLMRSTGRLKYAETLPYDTRCPIILPRRHWTTKLVVKLHHEQNCHSGTNQTLASLTSRFWVVHAREEIREWENECAKCRRNKVKPALQVMAQLPSVRVCAAKAFEQIAVDFAGPFLTVQGRGKIRQKRYLCLFTCLAVRAVHLEMAYGLDTDSFLRAFYRMTDRRGTPKLILSDNGTNFVGASKELRQLCTNPAVQASLASKGIDWKFNPPHAPHFGGVHESLIKSAKRAIYQILSASDVTDEELMSSFTGAEALLNSRPLTYQTSHEGDDVPLTPNHFLTGQMGGKFAAQLDKTSSHPSKRWRRVQELQRHFWRRWMREWLPSLNVRQKWFSPQRDLQVNDVVVLVSPDSPRGSWPLGKVVKVYPGKDGHVRVLDVQVDNSVLTRPVTKVCPLEWSSE